MGGFMRLLLLFIVIWYGVRFVFRFLLPLLTGSYAKRREKNVKKEGEVTLHYDKQRQQDFAQKEKKGEYIDYKEIE